MWHIKPSGPKIRLLFASAVNANARSINSLPNPFFWEGAGDGDAGFIPIKHNKRLFFILSGTPKKSKANPSAA